MGFGLPPASMGFVGYVKFIFTDSTNLIIRANSADIRLSQDITKPDVIDGRPDRSLYQLGPKIVEGSVEYPAIMERSGSGNLDPAGRLYKACVQREESGSRFGQLANNNLFDLAVRYTTNDADFQYTNCIINQWKFSAAQSDVVTINCDLIGQDRAQESGFAPFLNSSDIEGFPQNSRIVTWNDVIVNVISGSSGAPAIDGEYVRNFECTINNNAERYYTFNRSLTPQDIAVKKRDIDGSITLLGRHPQLGEHARNNQERCFEDSQIRFGYSLGDTESCQGVFLVTLPNVVFRIEELALTNDIFETTVQYHSFPEDLDLSKPEFLNTSASV